MNSLFAVATIREKIRLDPTYFSMPLEQGLSAVATEKLEQSIVKDLGIVLAVITTRPLSEGIVIHGDPAAYYECELELLTYKPEIKEILEAEIVELMDFGAFANIGPLDGLIHLSQIADDFMAYNRKTGVISGKTKSKTLKKGDIVYVKVATVSLKKTLNESKVSLTMKALGLGKPEWYLSEHKKEEKKKESKK